jgi:predicted RNA-binding protein Jag
MTNRPLGNYGVPVLKSFSPEQIEEAISKALSELAGEELKVAVNRIAATKGNSGILFGKVEMDVEVSRVQSALDELNSSVAGSKT